MICCCRCLGKLIKLNTCTMGTVYCIYINKADFNCKNNLNIFKWGWGETMVKLD